MATFSDREKAERVVTRLVEAGIPAELHDEAKLQKFWFASKPLAGEKVLVDEKDFDRACQFLEGVEQKEDILCGEVRCPKCGGADVQYPQFTRKFIMTTFVEVLCFLHLLDKQFYCKTCHHGWPVKIDLEKRKDVLNWPDEKRGLMRTAKG